MYVSSGTVFVLSAFLRFVSFDLQHLSLPYLLYNILTFAVAKTAGWVANNVDPYQTPQNTTADLSLQCLLVRSLEILDSNKIAKKKYVQKEPKSQNIAYKWHQEEELTDYDGQHTGYENMPIQIYWKILQPKWKNYR